MTEQTTAVAHREVSMLSTLKGKALSPEEVALLKRTICKGATDDEFAMFLYVCNHTGLNPFLGQIHAVKRRVKDGNTWRDQMTIQVGIDGLRLVSDRTGNYAPGPKPVHTFNDDGELVSTVASVQKYHPESKTWHLVESEAFYDEYVQKNSDGKPTLMWASKEKVMLAKCAEANAHRKAFPNETSGLYIDEEMPAVADAKGKATPKAITPPEATTDRPQGEPIITEKQRRMLFLEGGQCGHKGDEIREYLKQRYGLASSKVLPEREFQSALDRMHNTTPLFNEQRQIVDPALVTDQGAGDEIPEGREPGED